MTRSLTSSWPESSRQAVLSGDAVVAPASCTGAMVRTGLPREAHGFDFLIGRWNVVHRRLKQRLAGSSDWEEFPGTLDVRPILKGLGNVDQNVIEAPAGRYLA